MTKGWRLALWITAGLLAAAIAVGGFVGYQAWRLIHDPFRGYTATAKVIDVPRGTDARQILSNLQAEGVIADARLARLYLIYQLQDPFAAR